MAMEIAGTTAGISSGFRRVVDVFLAGSGLPFSQLLSAERIARICAEHGCLFGRHGIYSTPVVLWAFLIRSINRTLNLDHLRCKKPSMVLADVWATILAYNLVRTTAERKPYREPLDEHLRRGEWARNILPQFELQYDWRAYAARVQQVAAELAGQPTQARWQTPPAAQETTK